MLSACPCRNGATALGSSLWPSSGSGPTGSRLSCAQGSRVGCRTPGGVLPEQNRGAESPPSTCWPHFFWCSTGDGWPFYVQFIIHQVSPSPSWQGCSQALHPPSCIDTDGWTSPGAESHTWPGWTSWVSHGPTSQDCSGASGWHPVPQVCQLHYLALCYLRTVWGCTQSHCLCH